MPARDNNGAVRYLMTGNIPFTKELIDFNREKLEERGKYENEVGFQMTVDDIFAVEERKLEDRRKIK